MSTHLPVDCVIAVTYRCNSRCTMCDIWQIKDFPEFKPEILSTLPASLRDINISGGEPFLRVDLPVIIRTLKHYCPAARMVISSNGFATELIVQQMTEILKIEPHIGVAISIDGVGEMHDEMRGIPGGFDRAVATVRALQDLGMTNLRLGFTIGDRNANHLSRVYDLSRELGVQFTHSFAQSSEFYFGGKQNTNTLRKDLIFDQYEYLIKKELKTWRIKNWLRAYYAFAMRDFILSHDQPLSGAPGRDFFFLDPAGRIYPSVVHNVVLGDLNIISDFMAFWLSPDTNKIREQVDALRLPVWMMCTARTAMLRNPIRVLWWVFKNKFFAK